jgi:hypothetical protein
MKSYVWRILSVALVVVIYVARQYHGRSDTIGYRGEQFKMRKAYWTYEDYKDDPNNLDTNELGRIEAVMAGAKFPSHFDTDKGFFDALFKLKFPGYGLGGIDSQAQTDDGSKLFVEAVEIPQRDKSRYLVARDSGGQVAILDDFVSSTATNEISQVKLQGTNLFYYDARGTVVREAQVTTK